MVKKAAEFARKVHEGKLRKGSMVPYIVHPFEAAVIVSGMTDDPEVISAALLHDVIEDAGISYEELKMQFGSRVADLVLAESEDKSRTWKERKSATIEKLRSAGRAEKLICLGDKLSNLRSTAADMLLRGDGVWQKFRVTDKNEHIRNLSPCSTEYLTRRKKKTNEKTEEIFTGCRRPVPGRDRNGGRLLSSLCGRSHGGSLQGPYPWPRLDRYGKG